MPRWHYRFILLTTHFGCGHVELAFYQDGKRITVYGVRNTARSNAERIGWGSAAASLALTDSTDESHIVFPVMRLLREHGYGVRLAPANECVSLCLSPTLLKPAAEPATASSLRRKYERLRRATRSHVA